MVEMKRRIGKLDMTNAGFIYLMFSIKHQAYKIGISIYPGVRLKDIAREYGDPDLTLLRSVAVTNMLKVEGYLHSYFKKKRIVDEWFTLSEKDIELFDDLTSELKNKYPTGDY